MSPQAIADAILHAAWQNSLFTILIAPVVVLIASRVRHRPAVIHALWMLVLLKLVTPTWVELPLLPPIDLSVPSEIVDQAIPPDSGPLIAIAVRPDLQTSDASPSALAPSLSTDRAPGWTSYALLGAWAIGVLLVALLSARRIAQFRRLLHRRASADPVRQQALLQRLRRLARKMGLRHTPIPTMIDAPMPPMIFGVGRRARLILSTQLLDRLQQDELDTVLMHELAHYGRGDPWVRCVELVITALYFWHPVVWLARRELHVAEEECCDAWVVQAVPEHTRAFATALIECATLAAEQPPLFPAGTAATHALGVRGVLKKRVELIMLKSSLGRLSLGSRAALIVTAATLLPISPGFSEAVAQEGVAQEEGTPPTGDRPALVPASSLPEATLRADGPKADGPKVVFENFSPAQLQRQMDVLDEAITALKNAGDVDLARRLANEFSSSRVILGRMLQAKTRTSEPEATPPTKLVLIPAALLEISDDADPVAVGGLVTYTVKLSNLGNAPLTGVAMKAAVAELNQTHSTKLGMNLEPGEVFQWMFGARPQKSGLLTVVIDLSSSELTRPVSETEVTTVKERSN